MPNYTSTFGILPIKLALFIPSTCVYDISLTSASYMTFLLDNFGMSENCYLKLRLVLYTKAEFNFYRNKTIPK